MHAALLISVLAVGACDSGEPNVVLFSRTLGERHQDAIDAALRVLPDRLASAGYSVRATEAPEDLHDLSGVDAVVFLYTSGNDILDSDGKRELDRFVHTGGGWVGIHSAADTEYEWPFYQELVVAHYGSHSEIQSASMDLQNVPHPAMVDIPLRWEGEDEWYNFLRDAGTIPGVQVLANLDETSYTGGDMGAKHPIIWAHQRFSGRAIYSGLGHSAARWDEPLYVGHVAAMIEWAAEPPAPVTR
jgi:type 1 glutamine amidotransferase